MTIKGIIYQYVLAYDGWNRRTSATGDEFAEELRTGCGRGEDGS